MTDTRGDRHSATDKVKEGPPGPSPKRVFRLNLNEAPIRGLRSDFTQQIRGGTMAYIAVQRIKREFKEVLKSEEVSWYLHLVGHNIRKQS